MQAHISYIYYLFIATNTILIYSLTTVLQDALHQLGQAESICRSLRLHETCMRLSNMWSLWYLYFARPLIFVSENCQPFLKAVS